jgi:hypothetical protein
MGEKSKGKEFRGYMCASPGCRARTWSTFHFYCEYDWCFDPRGMTGDVVEHLGGSNSRRSETLGERLARLDSELEIERGDLGARGEGRVPGC